MRPIAMVALVAVSGCAYGQTAGRRSADEFPNVYDAHGWDSGLAYGIAMNDAHRAGWEDDPDAVDMDCSMYGIKPAVTVILGGLAGALLAQGHFGFGSAVGAVAVPVWFLPNCHATVGYQNRRRPPPTRAPVVAPPEAVDPPIRMLHQPATVRPDAGSIASPDGGGR
jgi:hypothetical protein